MTDLTPTTALGATQPQQARFGALHLAEDDSVGLASFSLRRGQAAPQAVALPGPGGFAETKGIGALWSGPDQWMILGAGRATDDFAAEVAALLPGGVVTDQTDAWAVFQITSDAGPAAIEALLSKLVNIDLAGFGPGRATRTGLEHMSVFVLRRSESQIAVLGMRSAAASLWHALTTAAARLDHARGTA
ncbi:MAG: sarcosine oxidase subunit gamma [Rhodobacteraceae bacterium]|nr:sarcosine oxidase subunit gamma [Paracoccaceae bacterium]